jgi:S-adenosyl methyltransferase
MAGERSNGITPNDGEPTFDTSVAHVARVYSYWLGGKDNFAADRAAGEQAIKAFLISCRQLPGTIASGQRHRCRIYGEDGRQPQ